MLTRCCRHSDLCDSLNLISHECNIKLSDFAMWFDRKTCWDPARKFRKWSGELMAADWWCNHLLYSLVYRCMNERPSSSSARHRFFEGERSACKVGIWLQVLQGFYVCVTFEIWLVSASALLERQLVTHAFLYNISRIWSDQNGLRLIMLNCGWSRRTVYSKLFRVIGLIIRGGSASPLFWK